MRRFSKPADIGERHQFGDARRALPLCRRRGFSGRSRCCPQHSCWETTHRTGTPCRHCAARSELDVMSLPSNSTFPPASGSSRPAMMRSMVVLPQPEGPSSTSVSPRAMSRVAGSSARVPSAKVLPQASIRTDAPCAIGRVHLLCSLSANSCIATRSGMIITKKISV